MQNHHVQPAITKIQIRESTLPPDESVFTQARYSKTNYPAGHEVDRGQLRHWSQRGIRSQDFEVRAEVSRSVWGIAVDCELGRGWRVSVVAVYRGVEGQSELRDESLCLGVVVFACEELRHDLILSVGVESYGRGEVGITEGSAGCASADGCDGGHCAGHNLLSVNAEERDGVRAVESVVDITQCGDGDWSASSCKVITELRGVIVIDAVVGRCETERGNRIGMAWNCGQEHEEAGR